MLSSYCCPINFPVRTIRLCCIVLYCIVLSCIFFLLPNEFSCEDNKATLCGIVSYCIVLHCKLCYLPIQHWMSHMVLAQAQQQTKHLHFQRYKKQKQNCGIKFILHKLSCQLHANYFCSETESAASMILIILLVLCVCVYVCVCVCVCAHVRVCVFWFLVHVSTHFYTLLF